MKIIIACDHGGFTLKNFLIDSLKDQGYEVEDYGAYELNDHDDYPDYVIPAMNALQNGFETYGIVICRNGVGVSMVANKFKGVRCALSWDKRHIITAKTDDDVNVLALPADYVSEKEALEIVNAFLETPFSKASRHVSRLEKIDKL